MEHDGAERPAWLRRVMVVLRRLLAPVAAVVVGSRLEDPAYRVWHALTGSSAANTRYDLLTVQIMRRVLSSGGSAVDVGAHRGTILRQMVTLAPGGRHFALEPLPVFAAGLRRRFPMVEVHQVAADDHAGEAVFHHVVTNPSYSGLRRRPYPDAEDVVRPLTVRTACLDDVVPPDAPLEFVKIDVEGSELSVLRGARRLLRRWRPVVVLEHGRAGADVTGELFAEVESDGLGLFHPESWLAGEPPLGREGFVEAVAKGAYCFVAAPATGQPN